MASTWMSVERDTRQMGDESLRSVSLEPASSHKTGGASLLTRILCSRSQAAIDGRGYVDDHNRATGGLTEVIP